MTNFEQNLEKLERLTADIKRSDVSLEEALKDFEQGIKLARTMEKEIDKIEDATNELHAMSMDFVADEVKQGDYEHYRFTDLQKNLIWME